ncbi:MAG: dihydroneopterin aldolase, partial [Caulobacteraceae bacterium]
MAVLPATQSPSQPPVLTGKVVVSKIFVHGIRIDAEVGVYPSERGRTQPLIVDVELDVAWAGADRLADTVNYETVVAAAKAVADEGHIELVEVYAEHLAARCFLDSRVSRVRVRVDKPQALAPHAAGAGVEIT